MEKSVTRKMLDTVIKQAVIALPDEMGQLIKRSAASFLEHNPNESQLAWYLERTLFKLRVCTAKLDKHTDTVKLEQMRKMGHLMAELSLQPTEFIKAEVDFAVATATSDIDINHQIECFEEAVKLLCSRQSGQTLN